METRLFCSTRSFCPKWQKVLMNAYITLPSNRFRGSPFLGSFARSFRFYVVLVWCIIHSLFIRVYIPFQRLEHSSVNSQFSATTSSFWSTLPIHREQAPPLDRSHLLVKLESPSWKKIRKTKTCPLPQPWEALDWSCRGNPEGKAKAKARANTSNLANCWSCKMSPEQCKFCAAKGVAVTCEGFAFFLFSLFSLCCWPLGSGTWSC